MNQRLVRPGDGLTSDLTVVVRGGLLDPETLIQDATRNLQIRGVFGVSVVAAKDLTVDELAWGREVPPRRAMIVSGA